MCHLFLLDLNPLHCRRWYRNDRSTLLDQPCPRRYQLPRCIKSGQETRHFSTSIFRLAQYSDHTRLVPTVFHVILQSLLANNKWLARTCCRMWRHLAKRVSLMRFRSHCSLQCKKQMKTCYHAMQCNCYTATASYQPQATCVAIESVVPPVMENNQTQARHADISGGDTGCVPSWTSNKSHTAITRATKRVATSACCASSRL